MNNKFNRVTLGEYMGKLPIGILTKESETSEVQVRLRDVVYRKCSHEDMKLLHDETFRRNHPFKWVARAIGMTVESIGGTPIYEEFKRNGFKPNSYPEIINHITSSDAAYLLYTGHIHNFGNVINEIDVKCKNSNCRRSNIINIDLSKIALDVVKKDHDGNEIEFPATFDVQLKNGFRYVTSESEDMKHDPLYTSLFTKMTLECATLGQSIRNEAEFSINDQSNFTEKIHASCMVSAQASNGIMLPKDRISMLSSAIYKFFTGEDSVDIASAMNDLPGVVPVVNEICSKCSEDLPVIVSTGFLFPRRR